MKRRFILPILSIQVLALALAVPLHGAEPNRGAQRKLDPRLQTFFAAKERHARALTKELKLNVSPDVWAYFDAGIKGDWAEVKNVWQELRRRAGQYEGTRLDETVQTVAWQPLLEAELAYEGFSAMDVKFIDAFAREVIDSIPRGSIYFGGTDPGRGLVTALCASHEKADPFFTLTQRSLADGRYLEYLRTMYGDRIYTPTAKDSEGAFKETA